MRQPEARPIIASDTKGSAGSSNTSSVWWRPRALGYAESLRGLGGIVSPLLAGLSLAAIATLATSDHKPPLTSWAVAALAATVVLLLYSMQVAFLSLNQNSTPADILMWHPEAMVSEEELQRAREVQAADFKDMERLGKLSFLAYSYGLITFLVAVLLLMVPAKWSIGWMFGMVVTGLALLLEIWWIAATHFQALPHPVVRRPQPSHRAHWTSAHPPPLDELGLAAVMDPDRRKAAALATACEGRGIPEERELPGTEGNPA